MVTPQLLAWVLAIMVFIAAALIKTDKFDLMAAGMALLTLGLVLGGQ